MRRSRSFRVFAALFAPWFVLVVAEPVPMHDCPMHSMHPAAMHHMAGDAPATVTTPNVTHLASGPVAPDMPAPASHHQCCCLGCCCATALMELARAPQADWAPAEIRRDVPTITAAPFVPQAAEHVLPFANGPPAARA